ncbi:hypothetical protein IGI04_015084, partial [Brassica rapa subsp. trilocularis]
MGPAPEHLRELKVAELIDKNRRDWDREKVQRTIPHCEEQILNIKLSKEGAPDKIIWLKTTTGEYTTKSGPDGPKMLTPDRDSVGGTRTLDYVKASSPEDVISRAISSAREWLEAQEPPVSGKGQHVVGEPTLTNCYKVQTDAAWREDIR